MKVEGAYITCFDHRCINYWEDMCTLTVGRDTKFEIDIIPTTCDGKKCYAKTCSDCSELEDGGCKYFKVGTSEWYDIDKIGIS